MMRTITFVFISVILESRGYGKIIGDCSPQVDMHCTLHKLTGGECFPGNLSSKFPFYETSTAKFPGKPGSFDPVARYRYRSKDEKWYPGVNFTFTTPQNAGKNYVKGFEISRYEAARNQVTCYILDLSNVTWDENSMAEMDTTFSLDLFPLNPGDPRAFVFDLYALPKQEIKDERFDQNLHLYIEFPVYIAVDVRSPRNWRATIYHKNDNNLGTINVTIEKPPDEYNFTLFEYSLVNYTSQSILDGKKSRKIWHQFTGVHTGNYQIWVKPIRDEDVCPCKDPSGQICDHCATTITKNFTLTYTGLPLPTKTTKTPGQVDIVNPVNTVSTGLTSKVSEKETTERFQMLTTESPAVSKAQVAIAVVGAILGIVLAIVGVFIYHRRCRHSEEEKITQPDKPSINGSCTMSGTNPGFDDISSILTFPIIGQGINNGNAGKLKFEKIPKLCLLFEEDHEFHRAVVENFATYLKQHCQCVSMCVEWQLDTPWVHEDINQADFIIIVNSEGAYTSYMAKYGQQNSSTVVNQSSPMTRRMSSINSVKNKFLQDERYDNIVMVYFDYTDQRYILPDICPGYKYQLPKHFTEFLLHIHKLRRTDNLSKYDLPFDGNHITRPIGRKLLESIAEAERFQQQNPKWLQKRFEYDRMWSHTSDESRFDSGIPEDFNSPGNTPQIDKPSPFHNSSKDVVYHNLLEGRSILTVNPSDIGLMPYQQTHCLSPEDANVSHVPKSRPKLSPQSFTANPRNLLSHLPPSPPTCETIENTFAFIPPDDFDDDFDVKSKTQSEQMKSIVDRYQAINSLENVHERNNQTDGYDRNRDLLLLKVHSGEAPFNSDVVSLGGESV